MLSSTATVGSVEEETVEELRGSVVVMSVVWFQNVFRCTRSRVHPSLNAGHYLPASRSIRSESFRRMQITSPPKPDALLRSTLNSLTSGVNEYARSR